MPIRAYSSAPPDFHGSPGHVKNATQALVWSSLHMAVAAACRWNRDGLGLAEGIFESEMGNKRKIESFWLLLILLTAIHRSCACFACRDSLSFWEVVCTTDLAWLFLFQVCWDEEGGGSSPVKASGAVLLSGVILSLMIYLNLQKARC